MSQTIPVSVLALARKRADLTQTQVAKLLNVTPSVVSKLEAGEFADAQMAKRYLEAVGTELGADILRFYGQRWRHIERPTFLHPERDALWSAEQAMQSLHEFRLSKEFDEILEDPLARLLSRISIETEFIRSLEHRIAFIGEIGVGKTTALSFVTNLVASDKSGIPQSVFPTGSGRTTVCEVAIKIAPTFGIAVDSLSEEEIRALVSELVKGLNGQGGIPSEIERVIRNMANLRRAPVRATKLGERAKASDPLKDLADSANDVDDVVAEVLSRMKLDSRTDAPMILSRTTEGSMEWLSENIAKINYGQHPDFSVPERITVLLPLEALRATPYGLSIIDTKGVEGTTQRPDLKAQVDDARTVTVLCSRFADAPGTVPASILREVVDSGSDAVDSGRLCLLVLPQDDQALKLVDDTGSRPQTAEDGYAIRDAQIAQQLSTDGLPRVPVNFYNVRSDPPEVVWEWLTSLVADVRRTKVARVDRLVKASADLISNSDIAKTREARRAIAETMERAVARFEELPSLKRPAHLNLVEQAKQSHQSSISASVNRRGKWPTFDVAHILGVGVRTDANLRTRDLLVRLDEQLAGMVPKYANLPDIQEYIESIQDDLKEWKQEFLIRTSLVGRTTFAPHLKEADALWAACAKRYGAGAGYRIDISDLFMNHFQEDPGAGATIDKIEASIQKLWLEMVIAQVREAIRFQDEYVNV